MYIYIYICILCSRLERSPEVGDDHQGDVVGVAPGPVLIINLRRIITVIILTS